MHQKPLFRRLWLVALVLYTAVILFPVSSGLTRLGGLGLFGIVWFGLIGLFWHRRVLRFALLGFTVACVAFLALPARPLPAAGGMRGDYVAGLRRYEGVKYFWGGESPKGIDCSGLIRRGLIDSLFVRGIRTLDPGLVRHSLSLWWHDTTAKRLGSPGNGLTTHLADAASLNVLDHSPLLPGDLAVTENGLHVMAYLGDQVWIEADPGIGRVIAVPVPTTGNGWFEQPMKIVRWRVLSR